MTTITATPPELAQETWDKLDYWLTRAKALNAADPGEHADTRFTLMVKTGVVRLTVADDWRDLGDVFWLSWSPRDGKRTVVHIYPDKILYCRKPLHFDPLDESKSRELCDLLEPGGAELASPVHVPYGLVYDNRVIGLSYNAGRTEDTFVLDASAYNRLFPSAVSDVVEWYRQFWLLREQGSVVHLSERIHNLPWELWAHTKGLDTWLEFSGTDGRSPAFIVGAPYRSWDVTTNQASKHPRTRKEFKAPLRTWFD